MFGPATHTQDNTACRLLCVVPRDYPSQRAFMGVPYTGGDYA